MTLDSTDGWKVGGSFGGGTVEAMKLPAVNACIEILSDSIAKMPVALMDSKTREKANDHSALRLLTERPNEAMTAFDFHKLTEARRICEGNAYVLIRRDGFGVPVELLPISPGYMEPYMDEAGRLWYVGTNPQTGEYRKIWNTDVLHFKAFSRDGLTGISYLKRGREVIEAALQAQAYEAAFYRNGAKLSGVLQTDTDLSHRPSADGAPTIKDKIRAEWSRIHTGADNAYRIAVLDNGLKFTPISVSNADAQFIETKAASIEDIARLFNVPMYKLGAGKQTYESNEQAAIEYMQRTLSPIVAAREQEMTYKLLTEDERQQMEFRLNMMGELRGAWGARGEWFAKMRETGVYSVNDIRALEDLPDVAGGDTRNASLNYVPLELFYELSVKRNTGGESE